MEVNKGKAVFKRTEEVEQIVNRMPQKFGLQVTIIVCAIMVLALILGYLISYPDVQRGAVTINTESPAIKIVSNHSGKILLLKKSNEFVQKGDIIGYLENPANFVDIVTIDSILDVFQINNTELVVSTKNLPTRVYLGGINARYYLFLEALQQFQNYYSNNLYSSQLATYQNLIEEQGNLLDISHKKMQLSSNSLELTKEFERRDSILFEKRIISQSELEKNKMNYLNAEHNNISGKNEISQINSEILRTQNMKNEVEIKKTEIEEMLFLKLNSAYHELRVALKQFEETYLFRSPQDGRLQYLSFLNNNLFVKAGDAIFSIVPSDSKILAQVMLPNVGAGKVEQGQEVVLKLDNYPYNEFGSIRGTVKEISLVTNTQETAQGNIESYLVQVDLPNGLKTNFGIDLDFKFELKGAAEIITKERRLINRVFDNINYMLSNKKG